MLYGIQLIYEWFNNYLRMIIVILVISLSFLMLRPTPSDN